MGDDDLLKMCLQFRRERLFSCNCLQFYGRAKYAKDFTDIFTTYSRSL